MRGKEIYKIYNETFDKEMLKGTSKKDLIKKIEEFRTQLLNKLAHYAKKGEPREPRVFLNFYHKGISFKDAYSLMRSYKTYKLSLDEVLELCQLNSTEPLYLQFIETIKSEYGYIKPYTKEEVIKFFNEEELDALGFPF